MILIFKYAYNIYPSSSSTYSSFSTLSKITKDALLFTFTLVCKYVFMCVQACVCMCVYVSIQI